VFSALSKPAVYIAVIAMLTTGLWSKSEVIQQIAACLFLALEAGGLVECYKAAKVYSAGMWEPESKDGLEKVASVLRNIIIIAGLILCISLNMSGIIIWVGVDLQIIR